MCKKDLLQLRFIQTFQNVFCQHKYFSSVPNRTQTHTHVFYLWVSTQRSMDSSYKTPFWHHNWSTNEQLPAVISLHLQLVDQVSHLQEILSKSFLCFSFGKAGVFASFSLPCDRCQNNCWKEEQLRDIYSCWNKPAHVLFQSILLFPNPELLVLSWW